MAQYSIIEKKNKLHLRTSFFMKKILLFILPLLHLAVAGQSKLTVFGTDISRPLANATVTCQNKTLGITNSQGVVQFKTKCKEVQVQAPGYYQDFVVVDKVMELVLSKVDAKTQSIEGIKIEDKSDPRALEILKKVNENYSQNAPQSLDSYSFKSYEKISLDIDQDSIQDYNQFVNHRIDSLRALPKKEQVEKKKKDSIESLNVVKLVGESKLFLWERVSEFKYSQKFGEKVTILDNKVSGLQNPMYEMMTLRSNRNRVPREIREENRALYRFFLTDTIEIEGRKNFVIRFRQADYKTAPNRRKFNGYLYIDTQTFGLKKIESNSNKKSEGSITSIWKPLEGKWFLSKENVKFKVGSTAFNTVKSEEQPEDNQEKKKKKKFGNYLYLIADYFDIQSPIAVAAKDFRGYTMEVKNADGSLLDQYRTDTLSAREKLTYTKIDSVGKKYQLDNKISAASGLLRGNVRLGMVDFGVLDLLKYNQYEGVRLGAALKLNEKFNPYFSPDVYVGYGFKDHTWKFGAGIDVKTTLRKTSFFRAEYYNDVQEAGRFNENLWNFKMKIMNSGVDLNNDKFYKYEGFKLSYQNDLSNALTMEVSAKKDQEEAGFLYDYNQLGNRFKNFAAQITLKYSPNSKNIMTPGGKFTYEQKYPEFYFNYEQGLETMGGTLNYSKFDLLAAHSFKTTAGNTGLRVYGGLLTGEVPIWHHFAINGLGNDKTGLNYNLTSYLGFATMEGGKYYDDKFAGYFITHKIPFYFRTFGKRTSSFDLLYKGIAGDMKNKEQHNFNFQKLDHLYQEVGFESNNILGTPFNLGFFYRIGHYATPKFIDNFAIQLKLNILGF